MIIIMIIIINISLIKPVAKKWVFVSYTVLTVFFLYRSGIELRLLVYVHFVGGALLLHNVVR